MSSPLHEAVQLAQAGRRDEARAQLLQIVQSDPNNEMAWLWLASVAADQPEYQRALNEVLRINPANHQARQLLVQFQQQYAATQPPPYASQQPYYAPPPAPQPHYGAPPQPYMAQPPVKKRGGCGCGRTCLLLVFLFIILPLAACLGLAYSPYSLGLLDLGAVYLPGEFGRKTVNFEAGTYEVSITVPRTWYAAETGNLWWESWRDSLDSNLPFDNADQSWAELEIDPAEISAEDGGLAIVETNIFTLMSSGSTSGVTFQGVVDLQDRITGNLDIATFSCENVRRLEDRMRSPGGDVEVIELEDDLCAIRIDRVQPFPEDRIFQNYNAPDEIRLINFVTPSESQLGSMWQISLPAEQYGTFQDDIDHMIKTAAVKD